MSQPGKDRHTATDDPRAHRRKAVSTRYLDASGCLGPGQSALQLPSQRTSKWGGGCQTTGISSLTAAGIDSLSALEARSLKSRREQGDTCSRLQRRSFPWKCAPAPGLQASLAHGCITTVSTTVILWPSPYVSGASPLFTMSPVLGFRTLNPE